MTALRGNYGISKADAVRAHHDGLPALLPNGNRWKTAVSSHRYGEHGEHEGGPARFAGSCPACAELMAPDSGSGVTA